MSEHQRGVTSPHLQEHELDDWQEHRGAGRGGEWTGVAEELLFPWKTDGKGNQKKQQRGTKLSLQQPRGRQESWVLCLLAPDSESLEDFTGVIQAVARLEPDQVFWCS